MKLSSTLFNNIYNVIINYCKKESLTLKSMRRKAVSHKERKWYTQTFRNETIFTHSASKHRKSVLLKLKISFRKVPSGNSFGTIPGNIRISSNKQSRLYTHTSFFVTPPPSSLFKGAQ